jgi:hypothetical protein
MANAPWKIISSIPKHVASASGDMAYEHGNDGHELPRVRQATHVQISNTQRLQSERWRVRKRGGTMQPLEEDEHRTASRQPCLLGFGARTTPNAAPIGCRIKCSPPDQPNGLRTHRLALFPAQLLVVRHTGRVPLLDFPARRARTSMRTSGLTMASNTRIIGQGTHGFSGRFS